jgi:outer membrane usher protein
VLRFFSWLFVSALFFRPVIAVAAPTGVETLLAIEINNQRVSVGSIVLKETDGSYALDSTDLNDWRLVLSPDNAKKNYDHQYILLRDFPSIKVHLNEDLQQLELNVPASYFAKTIVTNSPNMDIQAAQCNSGVFLNYDLREQNISSSSDLMTGIFDSGLTLGAGVIDSSFVGAIGSNSTGLRRVATSWQHIDPTHEKAIRIGDSSGNNGALVVGRPFFGVQASSDFSATPAMQVAPRPLVIGSTAQPANAEIYANGKLVLRQELPSGPFQIDNIPVPDDAGQLQVVVKTPDGHQQVVASPYYAPNNLLKEGLTKFSWGAGLEATPMTNGSEHYGAPLAEFFNQRGLTNRLTAEIDGMLGSDGDALSAGSIWLLPGVGTLNFALSSASGTGIGGSRFGYEYLAHRLHFGFTISSLEQQSNVIATPGIFTLGQITHQAQAHLSMPLTQHSALSFQLAHQSTTPLEMSGITNVTNTVQGTYSTSFGASQLMANLFHSTGTYAVTSATINLLIPIDSRNRIMSNIETQGGKTSGNIQFSHDARYDAHVDEPGYQFSLGPQNGSLQINESTSHVDLEVGISHYPNMTETQLDARGSISNIDHHFYLSHNILQAYGIAEVPGYPHVKVTADNQYVGTTDKRGNLLIPNLQPYQKNKISLDTKDFPITANLEAFEKDAIPTYHSPAIARFTVHGEGGVVVHIKLWQGGFLPAGATLNVGDRSWPVLDEGEAYLDGITPGIVHMTAHAGDMFCHFNLELPKDITNIPDLGNVICLPGT